MEDSQFIVALVAVQFVLSFLRCVTLALQSTECILVDAYADVVHWHENAFVILEMRNVGKDRAVSQPNWHQLLGSLLRGQELQEHKFIEAMWARSIRVLLRITGSTCSTHSLIM